MRTERLLIDIVASGVLFLAFFGVGLLVAPWMVDRALATIGGDALWLDGRADLPATYADIALALAASVVFALLVDVAYRVGAGRAPTPPWLGLVLALLVGATAFGGAWSVWLVRAALQQDTGGIAPMITLDSLELAASGRAMALRLAILLCAIAFFAGRRRRTS